MKIYIVVMDVVIDVTYSRKSVNTLWSYDFYDMTLSTRKQRLHMIKPGTLCTVIAYDTLNGNCVCVIR